MMDVMEAIGGWCDIEMARVLRVVRWARECHGSLACDVIDGLLYWGVDGARGHGASWWIRSKSARGFVRGVVWRACTRAQCVS